MFDLKRPCVNCPFRVGLGSKFRLKPARLREIASAPAFQCHKTVDYEDEEPNAGDRPQQCAGLMTLLVREERPNDIMRVALRLGALNADELDPDGAVYATWHDACAAHGEGSEP